MNLLVYKSQSLLSCILDIDLAVLTPILYKIRDYYRMNLLVCKSQSLLSCILDIDLATLTPIIVQDKRLLQNELTCV